MSHRNPQVVSHVYQDAGVGQCERLPQFSSIGSYTLRYQTRKGLDACAACASKWSDPDDMISHVGVYDEGDPFECEECGKSIESSYGPVV